MVFNAKCKNIRLKYDDVVVTSAIIVDYNFSYYIRLDDLRSVITYFHSFVDCKEMFNYTEYQNNELVFFDVDDETVKGPLSQFHPFVNVKNVAAVCLKCGMYDYRRIISVICGCIEDEDWSSGCSLVKNIQSR